ncbi:hypothetical protein KUL25_13895 [Rhodobacteraceae bacterium N5(2021)]|uniref:Na(+)-translocating NADH-quinone reductase subunit A n=1 Tax=Gymnodinialimonas phycosphaerae TaxID=2841589 RepID=A0A975TRZ4_9RHOB|nr:hypothetical protein [Gymnodinialimonas phycosphaerae]MBY4893859.1 hypothetical protein [Gymnodinialimonas phycosphaerae]
MTFYDPTPDITVPVALLGDDYPGLRIRLDVAQGDDVAAGQPLFHDAKRSAIAYVSPIQGRVAEVRYGPRRMLAAMVLDPVETGPAAPSDRLTDDSALRAYLLARGAWPAFIARPFGGPPDPDAQPDAIIVSALSSSPIGFAPREVLVGREAEFARGLNALTLLTDGPVHLCVEHGTIISNPDLTLIRVHSHRATKSWRTASGQTALVHPTGSNGQVWTIGLQDVLAIGHLLETGLYDPIRTITVPQPGTRRAVTQRVALGAKIRPLLQDALKSGPNEQVISGTEQHGRRGAYLGRYHDVVGTTRVKKQPTWSVPLPLVAFAGLNSVLPARVPAVPLMRALSIGDTQTCLKLGCLELLEEDVAPLSALCTSGTDYGQRLRNVLDQLHKDAA